MNCLDEEKLWEYLDGETMPSEKTQIESHLKRCNGCKEQLKELRLFDSEIATVVLAQPSMRFTRNVMELIEVELNPIVFKPLLRKVWRRLIFFGFASLLAMSVFVALVFPSEGYFSQEAVAVKKLSSDVLTFTQHPLILNSALILLSIWMLYLLDKGLLSKRKKVT